MIRSVPESVVSAIESHFRGIGDEIVITDFSYASGGCINTGGVVDSNLGKFFIKWNDKSRFPGMFQAELKGLNLLRGPDVVKVPEPIAALDAGSHSFLITEYISSSSRSDSYWDALGEGLAALHKSTNDKFGLDHNNYIGSLPQLNTWTNDWLSFYIEHRLEYQTRLAVESGKISASKISKFERFYTGLTSLLPSDEVPSLLHGDLWGGNLMTGPNGEPVIFDPAVYYGNREVDLAMTQLFGGFSPRFYETYHESFPLLPGSDERIEIYQLYPLLVHANLFGGGYISQVEHIVNRYAS